MDKTVFYSSMPAPLFSLFFFFNDTATTEIYTLSLHDALPISPDAVHVMPMPIHPQYSDPVFDRARIEALGIRTPYRSEEHTSELQSQSNLVCRLLLEKKKKTHSAIQRVQTRLSQVAFVLCSVH